VAVATLRFRAPEAGRLDRALAGRPEVGSRTLAERLISGGAVLVDGQERAKSHRLEGGEEILVELPEQAAAPAAEEMDLRIAWEDEHLLIVDKPAGVVVHPGAGHATGTLVHGLLALDAAGGDEERPGIVHRLDRDTSGLLMVARTEAVRDALQAQLRARRVRREYLALVSGHPETETGTIDAPLGRDRRRRTVMSTRTDVPRDAVTHFEVERRLPRTALLRVRLETGRTHQIRAHLAAIGHPVCGDPAYGGRACGGRLGLDRQFLHATSLRFKHPVTGEMVVCESKPPVELRRALDVAIREPVSGGPDGD
jgi:23S rRNA pseudouridine1911/1915/1917 synthase